jgi:hypothetical protein
MKHIHVHTDDLDSVISLDARGQAHHDGTPYGRNVLEGVSKRTGIPPQEGERLMHAIVKFFDAGLRSGAHHCSGEHCH